MSAAHGNESHGHDSGGGGGLENILSGFGGAAGPARQVTDIFSGLLLGLFGSSGGGGHDDHHH